MSSLRNIVFMITA